MLNNEATMSENSSWPGRGSAFCLTQPATRKYGPVAPKDWVALIKKEWEMLVDGMSDISNEGWKAGFFNTRGRDTWLSLIRVLPHILRKCKFHMDKNCNHQDKSWVISSYSYGGDAFPSLVSWAEHISVKERINRLGYLNVENFFCCSFYAAKCPWT